LIQNSSVKPLAKLTLVVPEKDYKLAEQKNEKQPAT